MIKKYEVKAYHFPVDGFNYYVLTWSSVDGGRTFWNCGHMKQFRTHDEAKAYKKEMEG